MPADPLREARAEPGRGRRELAVMDDAGHHGGHEEGEGGHREEQVDRAAPDAEHGGERAHDDEEPEQVAWLLAAIRVTAMPTTVAPVSTSTAVSVDIVPSQRSTGADRRPVASKPVLAGAAGRPRAGRRHCPAATAGRPRARLAGRIRRRPPGGPRRSSAGWSAPGGRGAVAGPAARAVGRPEFRARDRGRGEPGCAPRPSRPLESRPPRPGRVAAPAPAAGSQPRPAAGPACAVPAAGDRRRLVASRQPRVALAELGRRAWDRAGAPTQVVWSLLERVMHETLSSP